MLDYPTFDKFTSIDAHRVDKDWYLVSFQWRACRRRRRGLWEEGIRTENPEARCPTTGWSSRLPGAHLKRESRWWRHWPTFERIGNRTKKISAAVLVLWSHYHLSYEEADSFYLKIRDIILDNNLFLLLKESDTTSDYRNYWIIVQPCSILI